MRLKLNKSWIVFVVALAVGAAAAAFAHRYLRAQVAEIEARAKGETVQLVVAKGDLAKGAALSADTLAVREVPREWAHSNAVTPTQFERVDGSALAHPAARGEPILWSQLEGQRAPTFSARLSPGRRAVTVPVDEISSVSGLVEPGDRIDLMVSVRREQRQINFVLLQSVTVLATGTKVELQSDRQEGRRTFSTITLDVTAEQARQVIAAREIGKVTALLRAPGDQGGVSGQRSDAAALLGLYEPVAGARSGVPVIHGGGGPLRDAGRLDAPAPPAARVAATATAADSPAATLR